jgi:uroporphyrinogen decarboxylase
MFGGTAQVVPAWLEEYPRLQSYIDELLRFDGVYRGWNITPVQFGICGAPPSTVIREDEHEKVIRTGLGGVEVRRKADFASHIVEYPVKGWDEWLAIKEKYLDPDDVRRFPRGWKHYVEMYSHREYPLQLTCGGVYGFARNLLGDEGLMYLFFDDPALVHDIIGTYIDMLFRIWDKMCPDIEFDLIESWEDMSYKCGCLVSPDIFGQFLAPYFKKIRAYADANKIPIVLVDSDGNTNELTGWMEEAGVNAMYPYESQAGNDVAAVLDRYPAFACLGGLDKNSMSNFEGGGKKAMDREMEKAEFLIKKGRFIPGPDHFVLSDVPFVNYKYFMNSLRDVVLRTKPGC